MGASRLTLRAVEVAVPDGQRRLDGVDDPAVRLVALLYPEGPGAVGDLWWGQLGYAGSWPDEIKVLTAGTLAPEGSVKVGTAGMFTRLSKRDWAMKLGV